MVLGSAQLCNFWGGLSDYSDIPQDAINKTAWVEGGEGGGCEQWGGEENGVVQKPLASHRYPQLN